MKTTIFSFLALFMIATLVPGLVSPWSEVFGDSDDDEYRNGMKYGSRIANPQNNPRYVEECGSCHMPYSPSLLPAKSWDKIMSGLSDHFGDNAELDKDTATMMTTYLRSHSADAPGPQRTYRFMSGLQDNSPPRISELPYIKRKHDEISPRVLKAAKLNGLSQCNACHQDAAAGLFDEDNVVIKGVGRWDD